MAFTSEFGSRDDVKNKIIIFVTDGRSNIKHRSYTIKTASDKLKTKATTVSSVLKTWLLSIQTISYMHSEKSEISKTIQCKHNQASNKENFLSRSVSLFIVGFV